MPKESNYYEKGEKKSGFYKPRNTTVPNRDGESDDIKMEGIDQKNFHEELKKSGYTPV